MQGRGRCINLMTDNEEDISDLLEKSVTKSRKYAAYRESYSGNHHQDKLTKERDIANDFLDYWLAESDQDTVEIANNENDPPDIICTYSDKRRLGLEVVELVDEGSVAASEKLRCEEGFVSPVPDYEWTAEAFGKKILDIVSRKECLLLKQEIKPENNFLLIHTDEAFVEINAERFVKMTHVRYAEFSRVFLVLSKSPRINSHPVIEFPKSEAGVQKGL